MLYRQRAKLEMRKKVLSSRLWAQMLSTFSAALVRRPSVSLVSPCCFSRFSPLPRSRGQIRKRDCIRLSRQGAPAGAIGWFFCRWAQSHADDLIQDLKCTTAFAINYHKSSGNVVRLNRLSLVDGAGVIRYGAIRVTLLGTDQTGAELMIFDWAYQLQGGNPQLIVR